MPDPDDASLVAAVLDGRTDRFAELVRRHQGGLYRYALSMVHDRDTAADMVQDAFVRAYASLGSCRDPGHFGAWLFRVLRNRCFDHLKGPQRRAVPLDEAGPLVDSSESPDARNERVRLRGEIRRALDRLPPVQREAFVMHYVHGLSYEDMAVRLDASVSALKMRVLRAREALAGALRERQVTPAATARLSIRGG